jgi:STE24 endopeptidase
MALRLRPVPVAIVAALAGVWAVAAYFLWQSSVPDLSLPHVDAKAVFGAHTLSRASDFETFLELSWIGEQILLVAVFAAYAARGAQAFMKSSAAGRVGTGIFLAMMGFALAWFVRVPFQVLDAWWEKRYHVLRLSYVQVVLGSWLSLGATFLALSAGVAIVMWIATFLKQYWWVAAVPVFTGIALFLSFVAPYVQPSHELRDPTLAAAAQRIQRHEGLSGIPVRVQDVHSFTPAENAFAAGLGSSRKVFLWDTLLTGGLTERQIETVLAHEFGHHAKDHLWKQIG